MKYAFTHGKLLDGTKDMQVQEGQVLLVEDGKITEILPADEAGKIDGAASLVHMMNLNTFTCGAFHVKNSGDVSALCGALRENILARHWMCGFPDKLVIVTVGDYIVSVYGNEELVDTFAAKLAAAYPNAKTVSDEPIVV